MRCRMFRRTGRDAFELFWVFGKEEKLRDLSLSDEVYSCFNVENTFGIPMDSRHEG